MLAWETECHRDPQVQLSYGLAADGGIKEVEEGRLSSSDAWLPIRNKDHSVRSYDGSDVGSPDSWKEWCAGMDSFGGLVLLAASLTA